MTAFPSGNQTIALQGPSGALEVAVDFPREAKLSQTTIALIAHPHPPDGGSMHNKVVTSCARALNDLGVIAVRFNFRGVGGSQGHYDGGPGEIADLLAVAAWIRQTQPEAALWLAGFSFGSWVALQAADRLPVEQMISIAPPVGFRDFSNVPAPACPWLVIQGEDDELVDADVVIAWASAQTPAPKIVRMAGTSHFFHGRLLELRAAIAEGVRQP